MASASEQLVIEAIVRDAATAEMRRIGTSVEKFAQKSARSLDKATAATTRMGRSMAWMGAKAKALIPHMGALVAAYVGFSAIGRAIKDSADFGVAMAEVSTITDTARVSMKGMEEAILDLSVATGQTATSLAQGLYQAISAGIPAGADATAFLAQSTKLAVAGLASTETAVDALTTVLNAYGKSVSEVTQVSDVLFKTVELGKLRLESLAGAIGAPIPLAAALGVSLEEVTAAIAALTKGGIDVNTAGRDMRLVFSKLIRPGKQAQEVLSKYGIDVSRARIETEGFMSVLKELKDKLGDNQTALATVFERVQAITAAFALTGKQANEFQRILTELQDAAGSTEVAFAKIMEEPSKEIERFFNAIKAVSIKVFAGLIVGVRDFLREVTAFEGFTELMRELGGVVLEALITALKDAASAMLLLVAAADGLYRILKPLIKGITITLVGGLRLLRLENPFGEITKDARELSTAFQEVRRHAEDAKIAIEGMDEALDPTRFIKVTSELAIEAPKGFDPADFKPLVDSMMLGIQSGLVDPAKIDSEFIARRISLGIIDPLEKEMKDGGKRVIKGFGSAIVDQTGIAIEKRVAGMADSFRVLKATIEDIAPPKPEVFAEAQRAIVRTFGVATDGSGITLRKFDALAGTVARLQRQLSSGRITAEQFNAALAGEPERLAKSYDAANERMLDLIASNIELSGLQGQLLKGQEAELHNLNTLSIAQQAKVAADFTAGRISIEQARELIKAIKKVIEQKRLQILAGEEETTLVEQLGKKTEKALKDLVDPAQMATAIVREFSGAFGAAFADVVTGARSAKEAFQEFGRSVISMIIQMIGQFLALKAIEFVLPGVAAVVGAASGGVFEGGLGRATPVRGYATGGPIVRRPHVAVIGEGQYNEAVVPLPDGRSIPVQMRGGGGAARVQNVNVNLSVVSLDPSRAADVILEPSTRDKLIRSLSDALTQRSHSGFNRAVASA